MVYPIHVQTSYFPFVEPDEICEQTIELLASEEEGVGIIKEEGSRAGRSKNIKNNLETEIRLVVLSMRKKKPVLLPVGSTQAVSFCVWNFSNKIEIYT